MNDVKETFMVISSKQTFEKIQKYYLKKGCRWFAGEYEMPNVDAKYIRCDEYNKLTYGCDLNNIYLIGYKQIYLKSNILDIE